MCTTPRCSRPIHPGYVVFGVDQHAHTRAAWFSSREHRLARLASNMAGFVLFELSIKTPARLREWLPHGTRLESGRFVVPRVRRGLYEKLCDLEELASRTAKTATRADGSDDIESLGAEADPSTENEAELLEQLVAVAKEYGGNEPEQD